MFDRREFMQRGLALGGLLALPRLSWAETGKKAPGTRTLVLLHLNGGNDGLNTVIPFGDDQYYKARPSLGIKAGQLTKLDDHIGLHPALAPLRAAWDDSALAVVQGVGYPDPNRSHFTSTDIWQTASTTTPDRWSGWVGRSLDRDAAGREVPGLQLDRGR